jgi:hypothetical protein
MRAGNAYAYAHSDGNCNAYGYTYLNPAAYSHTQRCSFTQGPPDSAPSAVSA